jgi:tRNA-dihydrouridine synthase A
LSPKQNREIPPLRHAVVHRLKRENPGLEIVINGGIETLDAARGQLAHVDGAMVGRAAYREPYLLAEADRIIFGEAAAAPSRAEIALAFLPYAARAAARGTRVHAITRHILGLFHGVPGGRAWRRHLGEGARRAGSAAALIEEALELALRSAAQDETTLSQRVELSSAA